jgi:crossover junction endodeoxyribonuclease RuvC
MTSSAIRILGIDPGLRRTGWGVIDIDGNRLIYVGCGSVESREAAPLAERLLAIHEGLRGCWVSSIRWKPPSSRPSSTRTAHRPSSSVRRGVAMLAPAMFGIAVAEYAPNQVKKTVVGAGHADKNQIRIMLGVLLPKAAPKTPDAADALAIAITHAHHRQSAILKLKVAAAR